MDSITLTSSPATLMTKETIRASQHMAAIVAEDINIIAEAPVVLTMAASRRITATEVTAAIEATAIKTTITTTITMATKRMTKTRRRTLAIGGTTYERINSKAWSPKGNGTVAGRTSSRVSTAARRSTA